MNAPPEANSEYSRGSEASRRLLVPRWQASETPASPDSEAGRRARLALALGALLGAVLVIVAQFTALYHLHSATSSAAIKTVGTGGNHAWAPIPLGLAAILIALIGDLPDAHSSGLVGSSANGYVQATASPTAGLYMETLGAVILIASGGIGLLMAAPQIRRRQN